MSDDRRVKYENNLDFWIDFDPVSVMRDAERHDEIKKNMPLDDWRRLVDAVQRKRPGYL